MINGRGYSIPRDELESPYGRFIQDRTILGHRRARCTGPSSCSWPSSPSSATRPRVVWPGRSHPIAVIVALFICVLLHEFGHSLVAQRLGIGIHSITLLPIGGVSNLESLPEKPSDEVKITLAGPLVNVVLAPIFFGVGLLLGAEPRMPTDLFTGIGSVGQFFFYLGYLNVVLALFNLIPAFPLDGGRVLRGALATRLGAVRATEIASRVGQLFAVAFFLIGLLGGNFLLALIGVFIFFGAKRRGPDGQTEGADARPERLGRHGYQAPHRNRYALPHLRAGS